MKKTILIAMMVFCSVSFGANEIPTQGGNNNTWGADLNNYMQKGQGWFDIRAFGAGTGESDAVNAAAIQATIDAAELVNGRVLIPEGDYDYDTKLTIGATISFVGVGEGSLLTFNGTGEALSLEAENLILKDFRLDAGSGSHTNGITNNGGASSLANSYFEHVTVSGFVNGKALLLEDAFTMTFVRCDFKNSDFGVFLGNTSGSKTVNDVTFHSCNFRRNDTAQVKIELGKAIGFYGGNVADSESQGNLGFHLAGNINGLVIASVYSEKCEKFIFTDTANVRGFNIIGCRIATNVTTGIAIDIDGCQEGNVIGNFIIDSDVGVNLGANNSTRGVTLQSNFYDNITTSNRVIGTNTSNLKVQETEIFQVQDGFAAGIDGTDRGVLTLWDGAGGNTPGYIKIHSPNGTAWYLFVEDDGTLKINNAVPTQNSDGSAVGGQTD